MAISQKSPSYDIWLERIIRLRDRNNIYSDYQIIRSLRRPFSVILEKDMNRAMDGLELRQEYETRYKVPALLGNCTILEVLIALAKRIAFMTSDSAEEEDDVGYWFWRMIDNLGMTNKDEINEHILTIWMERRFKFNGEGSPFPLRKCDKNQTNIEIWYQMQSYMNENYDIS